MRLLSVFSFCLMLISSVSAFLSGSGSSEDSVNETVGIRRLLPGIKSDGIIYPEEQSWSSFYLEIPENAIAVEITIKDAGADLDLVMQYEEPLETYEYAEFSGESEKWLENMTLYKLFNADFQPGSYYLDVFYNGNFQSILKNELGLPKSEIPFTIMYNVVRVSENPVVLEAEREKNIVLDKDSLFTSVFAIEEPHNGLFRLDVLESTESVLDIYVSHNSPAPSEEDIVVASNKSLTRESLVWDASNFGDGSFYVTIIGSDSYEDEIKAKVFLSLGNGPPKSRNLPKLPLIPKPASQMEKMRLATVRIFSANGNSASGSIISSDGLIVTSYHAVVWSDSKQLLSEVQIAIAMEPFRPAEEWFLAEVVEFIEKDDLALLKVVSDLWGRPLPENYQFPYWDIDREHKFELGDNLFLSGHPNMALGQSKFTLTRGTLTGGIYWNGKPFLQTDAISSGGSSGGSVSDSTGKLLGIMKSTVEDRSVQFTYFIPADRIPNSWSAKR